MGQNGKSLKEYMLNHVKVDFKACYASIADVIGNCVCKEAPQNRKPN